MRRVGRWLVVVFIVLALVVSGTWWLGTRRQYPFIRRFSGRERSSNWSVAMAAGSDERCFSFDAPGEEVEPALRGDMERKGWRMSYKDPALQVYERGKERAYFAVRRLPEANSAPALGESAECFVWLPYKPNWIEEQVGSLMRSFGWEPPVVPTYVEPYQDLVSANRIDEPGPLYSQTILVRNLTSRTATVRIEAFDVEGYEPEESLPVTIEAQPRSYALHRFRYSPDLPLAGVVTHNLFYRYQAGQSHGMFGGMERDWEPAVSAIPAGGASVMLFENPDRKRSFEIRALRFVVDGATVKNTPGIQRLDPGKELRIPFTPPEEGDADLSFEYRLLPNRRWRRFELGPD